MEATRDGAVVRAAAVPITCVADLAAVGQAIAQSGMFGVNNPGAGMVIAATCHAQGISLMEFVRTYHIVDGRPSMRSDAMLAEFRKRGGTCTIVENSVTRAAADFAFEGQVLHGVFTMDDARRTGDCLKSDGKTLKANWEKRPDDMLWARMVSRSVRRLSPEIVAGLYTPEEVQDFDGDGVPRGARPVQAIGAEEARRRESAAGGQTVERSDGGGAAAPTVGQSGSLAVGTVEGGRRRVETLTEAQRAQSREEGVDYEVCPIPGCWFGAKWDSFHNDTLKQMWGDPTVREGHREAIARVVAARRGAIAPV